MNILQSDAMIYMNKCRLQAAVVLMLGMSVFMMGCNPGAKTTRTADPAEAAKIAGQLKAEAAQLLEDEKFNDAFVKYREAREYAPGDFEIHYGLARTNEKLRDEMGALDSIERALQINPDSPEALELQGRLHLRLRNHEKAVRSLEKAVKLKPDFTLAWLNLSSSYRLNGQIGAAKNAAERAIETDPETASAHFALGEIYLGEEDLNEAIKQFKKAIQKDDQHALAYLRLADIYISQQRNLPQARKWAQKSAEIDGGDGTAAMVAAHVLYMQDEKQEAAQELAKAAEDYPQNYRIWTRLGSILKELGRDEQAEAAFNNAERFAPGSARGRNGNQVD
ncbi:MAG: tetratricopeptide repeat protein [Armatimonadota bacterium]